MRNLKQRENSLCSIKSKVWWQNNHRVRALIPIMLSSNEWKREIIFPHHHIFRYCTWGLIHSIYKILFLFCLLIKAFHLSLIQWGVVRNSKTEWYRMYSYKFMCIGVVPLSALCKDRKTVHCFIPFHDSLLVSYCIII